MGLDDEIRKLKREGAEPAKLIIAKVRSGVLTLELVEMAAALHSQDAHEALTRMGLKKVLRYVDFNKITEWVGNRRTSVISEAVKAIAKNTSPKPRNLSRKIAVSFACDVAEHVLHFYEADKRPREALELTRLWLSGKKISIVEINDKISKAYSAAYDAENINDVTANGAASAAAHAIRSITASNEVQAKEARASGEYDNETRSTFYHYASWTCFAACVVDNDEKYWQCARLAQYCLGDI